MIERCCKCVLPASFPGITFDNRGICNYCLGFPAKNNFVPSETGLKSKMETIIAENIAGQKMTNSQYHAVVGFSGGKDSTYLIHILKEKYGLNILAATFDNGYMSPQSFVNMRKVLEILDTDHVIVKPRHALMNAVFRHSAAYDVYPLHLLKFGSGICISCIRMVYTMCLRLALEKNIPMVMLGNTPGQIIQSENEIIYKDNKIPFVLRKNLYKKMAERIGDEVYALLMLTREEYKQPSFPYLINAFPLIGYNEEKIYSTIKALGWEKPQDVDPSSTNCRLNSLGIIKHKQHYHFHPYAYEMSSLVRLKIIDRETALERLADPKQKTAIMSEKLETRIFE